MSLRRRLAKGGATLLAGRLASQGASFARNIIVANLIGPANMGVAATFAMTVSLLEMISDFAASRLIVQDREGDQPRFQATAHAFQVARGAVSSLALLALARPVSMLFSTEEALWAYQTLAFVPFLRGFAHLDSFRFQREMRFVPHVLVQSVPQTVSLAAAWPIAIWLGNYAAVLWLLLGQTAIYVLATHAVAARRYQIGWEREAGRRLFRFGAPLAMNGVIFFAVMQGDRAVVGAAYTVEELGLFAVAATIAIVAGDLILGVSNPLLLPALSQAQDDPERFARRSSTTVQAMAVLAGAAAVGMLLGGQPLVDILYTEEYAPAGVLLSLLGASQGMRLLRVAPNMISLSRGDSVTVLYGSIVRTAGVAAALALALRQAPLTWIAAASIGGEVAASLVVCAIVARRSELRLSVLLGPTVCTMVVVVVMGAVAWASQMSNPLLGLLTAGVGAAVAGAILALAMPAARGEFVVMWSAFTGRSRLEAAS